NVIADMEEWIDLPRVLTSSATDAFLANSDPLFESSNNTYFLDFNDGSGRKRMYSAWDIDASYKSSELDFYYTNSSSTYEELILQKQVFRSQYNQIIRNLLDGPLSEENIYAFLDEINTPELAAAIAADPYNQISGDVPAKIAELKTWFSDRIENVRTQVDWDEPIAPPGTALLQDGFEGTVWDANWIGGHTWVTDTGAHGSYSSKAPTQSGSYFTCNPLDANDAVAIHIDFWFMKDDTEDTDDILLYYYNGTSYNLASDLDVLGEDDKWIHYTDTITDNSYFVTDFQIRFDATPERNENVWIDDIYITKELPRDAANLDGIGLVDFKDYAILCNNWMDTGSGLSGDIDTNDIVNHDDLDYLLDYWLE
ncbi:MAG: CotH kinase family protein, partial [Planctomycetota bacterium]